MTIEFIAMAEDGEIGRATINAVAHGGRFYSDESAAIYVARTADLRCVVGRIVDIEVTFGLPIEPCHLSAGSTLTLSWGAGAIATIHDVRLDNPDGCSTR